MSGDETTAKTRDMYLTGHGRLAWKRIVELLADTRCAWADYDGFHVGKPRPDQAPPYSHLWAWDSDASRLLRVRVDGEEGIVGELSAKEPHPDDDRDLPAPREVSVRVSTSLPWGDDGRIGRGVEPPVRNGVFTLYEPQLPASVTFVSWKEPDR